MQKKYNTILSAEEDFARAVALGMIVKRPLTIWHYLIPGTFIIDFLKRGSEIRRYSEHFLLPRKVALNAAQNICIGHERDETVSRATEIIKGWLNSLKLYSTDLHKSQMEVVDLLIDHYIKLFHVESDNYYALIKNAYSNQNNYEAYLSRLASAEGKVDRAIIDTLGETKVLQERLEAEQRQVEIMRKKYVEMVFLD
jgi:hypothetical protein